MTVKMTYAQLEQVAGHPSIGQLFTTKMPTIYALRIHLMQRALSEVLEPYTKIKLDAVMKYCDMDESGNPTVVNGQYQFSDEEKKKLYTEEMQALWREEVQIPANKVKMPISILENLTAQFSAADFDLFDLILEFEDDHTKGEST